DWAVEVGAGEARFGRDSGQRRGPGPGPDGGAQLVLGLRLAGALGLFWSIRGYLSEGKERLSRLLPLSAVDEADQPGVRCRQTAGRAPGRLVNTRGPELAAARAKALSAAGQLATFRADHDAVPEL